MSGLNSSGECCHMLENQRFLLNPLSGQLCGVCLLFSQTVLLPALGASAGQGPFPAGSLHVAIMLQKAGNLGGVNVGYSMPPDLRARR